MQIVEINDPYERKNQDTELAVGIDFGTTNSLIAISCGQVVNIIKSSKNQELIPSQVFYSAQNIRSIKRLFGKNIAEIRSSKALSTIINEDLLIESSNKSLPKWKIDGQILSPVEVASKIFLELKSNAEKYLGKKINKAVVTLPAYYDDRSRHEVMLAAKLAGFEVLRLLAEPTAAAYAYKLDKKVQGTYIVYDLGGGTFDISILHMSDGVLQVMATVGDNMLGGDDIDLLIYEYWQNLYGLNETYKQVLLPIAKQAKETLSQKTEFYFNIDCLKDTITITRYIFENLIKSFIQRTIFLLKQAILEVNTEKIEGIILAGGSTRIPLIKEMLQKNFSYPILDDIDPDKVVVVGAALQAENLTGNNTMLLIDTIPLSIGIELYGGLVERIIPRNSPIPYIVKKQYTTFIDNQDAIEIHVVQGEREFAKDCRSLTKFSLSGLPRMRAGAVKIEIMFSIDTNGVLSISASELTTQKIYSIMLKPSYGITKEEVDNILINAYKNIKVDYENKNLQEIIIQAEKLIYDVSNLIKTIEINLSNHQLLAINKLIHKLQKNIKTDKINKIRVVIEEVNSELTKLSNIVAGFIEEQIKGQKIKS